MVVLWSLALHRRGCSSFAARLVNANIDIVRFLVAATAILLFTVPMAFMIIFMEMKLIAFVNLRLGPNRTGPWGTLSSTIHGFKVLAKEDFTPTGADVPVFTLAPAVVYLARVMTLPGPAVRARPVRASTSTSGLLYFFAVGGLGVVGLMMAGWSSFNKYSLLGGLRAAAAIISYEIPLTLAVVGVIMLTGTLSLNQIVLQPGGQVLSTGSSSSSRSRSLIFFIAATAEGSRTPFDLTEADSEIVAGFATEYSGMRFGFFFFAEYVNVFILSALTVALFLGGWNAPFDVNPILRLAATSRRPAARIDPGSLGIGPAVASSCSGHRIITVLLALPFWMLKPELVVPEVAGRRLPAVQPAGDGCCRRLGSPSTSRSSSACSGSSPRPTLRGHSSCSCAAPCRGCASTS